MSRKLSDLQAAEVLKLEAAGSAKGTVYLAALAIRRLIENGGDVDATAITTEIATRYAAQLWTNLAARSVRREVKSLQAAWNREDLPNPWARLPAIRVDPVELRIVTASEEIALRERASRDLRLWIALCLETAARPGEICALRSEDVLRDRAAILIQSRRTARTKTRESRMASLRDATHRQLVLRVGRGSLPWGSAAPRAILSRMRRRLYRLCARVGIPKVKPQDLRRTVGTRLALAGVSPAIAARVLRHSDPTTTMRYYTRVQDADAAAAVARTWTA